MGARRRPKGMGRFEFRRTWCIGLLVILATAGHAQLADVSKDPRLLKPISIKLKIEQLPDALAKLSKLTGVKIESAPVIKDLKVTVMVQDVPAGLVLDKIAGALDCEWKADGPILRLSMDPDERTHRDRYIEAENQQALKEVQDGLATLVDLSSKDPAVLEQELRQMAGPPVSSGGAKSTYDATRPSAATSAQPPIRPTRSFLSSLNGIGPLNSGEATL